ncbi:MAG: hypothetical protein DRK00_10955 [Thermoprotei archaeon]|nr:MAG: hypothetical protein DRK00_10955 [Thermoprotei archaeon]
MDAEAVVEGAHQEKKPRLEWAISALEELLKLMAWVNMLRARYAREGLNTHALDERMMRLEKKLVDVLHEYLNRLEEAYECPTSM